MTSGWKVLGASVVGKSHIADGTPCQDAHAYRVLTDGTLVIAVGDGAGSAKRSHEGSRLVVDTSVETMSARLFHQTPAVEDEASWVNLFRDGLVSSREALEKYATSQKEASRQFATTLTCVVCTGEMFAVAQVGDGFCVVQEPDGGLATVTKPSRGEYANETTFVNEERAASELEVYAIPARVDAVVVSTDGLLRLALKLPAHNPSEQFFRPLLGFAARSENPVLDSVYAQLEEFLNSDRVNARTDDDKTLVIAVRDGYEVTETPASVQSEAEAESEAEDEYKSEVEVTVVDEPDPTEES